MSSVIDQQVQEALQAFRGNVTANSKYDLTVKFGNSRHQTFQIILQKNHPYSAPFVKRNGKEMKTPMTTFWVPAFTVCNLVEHLKVSTNNQRSEPLSIDKNEIMTTAKSYDPSQLTDKGSRRAFLETGIIPTVEKAINKIPLFNKQIEIEHKKVKHLEHEIKAMADQISPSGNNQGLSKKDAIASYRKEAEKLLDNVNDIKNDITTSEDIDQNIEKLRKAYEDYFQMDFRAQELQDRLDL